MAAAHRDAPRQPVPHRDPRRFRKSRGDPQRLRDIERGGVPNYFGPQRFGRDARTCGSRVPGGSSDHARERAARSFALSRRGAGSSTQSWPDACRTAAGTGCWRRCGDAGGAEAGSRGVDETLQARTGRSICTRAVRCMGAATYRSRVPRRRSSSRSRSRKPRSAAARIPSDSNTNGAPGRVAVRSMGLADRATHDRAAFGSARRFCAGAARAARAPGPGGRGED